MWVLVKTIVVGGGTLLVRIVDDVTPTAEAKSKGRLEALHHRACIPYVRFDGDSRTFRNAFPPLSNDRHLQAARYHHTQSIENMGDGHRSSG